MNEFHQHTAGQSEQGFPPAQGRLRLSGPTQQKPNALTPAFVLKAVRQWWLLALPVGLLLAAGAGAAIYFTFEPVYQAKALLRISYDYIVEPIDRPPPPSELIAQQSHLMRTNKVLGPVLEKAAQFDEVRDAEDQVAFLGQRLQVIPLGNTGLFNVAYTGTNPDQAAEIVNETIIAYFDYRDSPEFKRTPKVMKALEDERAFWGEEVKKYAAEVLSAQKKALPDDAQNGRLKRDDFDISPLALLYDQLIQTRLEALALARDRDQLKAALENDDFVVPSAEIQKRVNSHDKVQQLADEIAQDDAWIRESEAKFREGHYPPEYLQRDARRKRNKELLEKEKNAVAAEVKLDIEKLMRREFVDKIRKLEQQIISNDARENDIEEEYRRQLEQLRALQDPELELEFARGRLEVAQTQYDRVVKRITSIETEKEAPAPVQELERATPPKTPEKRIPYQNMLLAAGGAFCIPFGLAVLWEYRVRRISDSQQLESQASLPVIGEVASFPVRRGGLGRLTHSSRGLRLFEESIDSLRTFLVLAQPMRDVQILAVTSATPQEGKTCIASQLAVSIARCTGELTLLIDGDMRKPDIHDIFGVELEPGLAQVLGHEVSLEEAIDASWSDRIHILPAGRLAASPHQLLGNGALKSLLSEARQRYKHIVIDTPPVLSAGESLMLASAADASLLCVMRNRSRIDQVTRSCQRLTEAGAKVVGSVLSGVPVKQYAKYYGDYAYVRT